MERPVNGRRTNSDLVPFLEQTVQFMNMLHLLPIVFAPLSWCSSQTVGNEPRRAGPAL